MKLYKEDKFTLKGVKSSVIRGGTEISHPTVTGWAVTAGKDGAGFTFVVNDGYDDFEITIMNESTIKRIWNVIHAINQEA